MSSSALIEPRAPDRERRVVAARYPLHRAEFLAEIQKGDEKISALMRGKAISYVAGSELIKADCEHPYVYRLLKGWVGRIRMLEDGRSQVILIFLPGDPFAVKSLFVNRHPDSVVALCDAVVERIHYRDLHHHYVTDPDVASRCIWQIMEEERRLHNWVVGLGQGTAEERLAMLILELRSRLANAGVIASDELAFQLPLTQQQLGDLLGLTAVHVNRMLRMLRMLRERSLVAVRDGTVSILSLASLVKLAYPLLDVYDRSRPMDVSALAAG